MKRLDEDDPIYKVIDKGGGQACDINGVWRALDEAGYIIIPKAEYERLKNAARNAR